MKRIIFILTAVFIILTFAGSLYVIFGGVNAGYAVIPMIFAVTGMNFYRKIN